MAGEMAFFRLLHARHYTRQLTNISKCYEIDIITFIAQMIEKQAHGTKYLIFLVELRFSLSWVYSWAFALAIIPCCLVYRIPLLFQNTTFLFHTIESSASFKRNEVEPLYLLRTRPRNIITLKHIYRDCRAVFIV